MPKGLGYPWVDAMSMERPTCPECGDDEDYTIDLVYAAGSEYESGVSPWDEPGTAHREADPKRVNYYRCSNGHSWAEEL